MKIAEFRDLISALSDAMTSARSAATPHERRMETDRVERCCVELEQAFCATACRPGNHEGVKASAMILTARKMIRDNTDAFRAADAAWQAMAFGKGL